jgi:hypothetical protein
LGATIAVAAVMGLALGAPPAEASYDITQGWQSGDSVFTISTAAYKNYVYYGGGGSFVICAGLEKTSTGQVASDCGFASDPQPQARAALCVHGTLADVYNGDNSPHTMTARFFTNPC